MRKNQINIGNRRRNDRIQRIDKGKWHEQISPQRGEREKREKNYTSCTQT